MATRSLYEDCQSLIQRGHQNWKSYFSKWESFAKYEEDLPESELFNLPELLEKKKVKRQSAKRKSKALPSGKYKKNKPNSKKLLRLKEEDPAEDKPEVEIIQEYNKVPDIENLVDDVDNVQLEMILKSVFTEILKANKNEFQMFTVLSQTVSGEMTKSQIFHHRLSCNTTNPLQSIPESSTNGNTLCRLRNSYDGYLNRRWTFTQMQPGTRVWEQTGNLSLGDSFPGFKIHQNNLNNPQSLFPLLGSPTLRQTTPLISSRPTFSSSLKHPSMELKSLEWDSGLKSPNTVCRKINNEYFIKRSFLKMNIAQDGKRFRNLCLRKRTNSVTLSMENSNFITPERKPPERKCFSENVSQRKRTCPSKLFFGNEEEDSESDDETGKQTPIIHCRKKLKTQIISQLVKPDPDDCESIFDRVGVP